MFSDQIEKDKFRVYIVDDHQMLIDGIRALLKNDRNFEIVGTTTNPIVAQTEVLALCPDIVLTDMQMPGMDGLGLTRNLITRNPGLKVIVLTMFCDKTTIRNMVNAGASGYILKNTGKEELKDALRKVSSGGMFFSDEVAVELLKGPDSEILHQERDKSPLTDRELEIVKLIAAEFNNAAIADKLFISERTVETHRKNIFRKTETHTAIGLINLAKEKGWI